MIPNDILEMLKMRRSHFRKEFTGEKIPDEIIEYLLECAHQAPSHKHTLPWYFQVFSGTSLQKLTNKIVEINELDPNENTSSKSEKINQIPSEVSHILAICMKRNPEHSIPETEEICAVACAVENIYIGLLQFEDVGGYWCTGNGTYTPEMHHFLELTTEDKCLGFFFIGKLKQKRTHSNRPPVSNYIRWNL